MNATIVYNVGTDPFVQDRAYKKGCDRQYFCDGLAEVLDYRAPQIPDNPTTLPFGIPSRDIGPSSTSWQPCVLGN